MDKKLYWSQILTAGLLIGALCALPQYILWVLNITDAVIFSSIFQLIAIGAVLFVYGKKRAAIEDQGDGYTFGRAYGFAFLSSLFSGVVVAVLAWILTNVIDPAMVGKMIDKMVVQLEETGVSEEIVNASISSVRFFTSMGGLLFSNVFSMAIFGGLVGLVTSALVKRNPQL